MTDYIQKVLIALKHADINGVSHIIDNDTLIVKYADPTCINNMYLVLGEKIFLKSEMFGDEEFSSADSALVAFIDQILISNQEEMDNIFFI